tara:strand:- start:810 stop:1277 length:468 start_codon:yes stop_codon:yes gene_type:complete
MKIVQKAPSKIELNEKNSRSHSDAQVEQIADSIDRLGFNVPILITSDNVLIAGEGRLLASIFLELEKIPCIVLEHLSEDEMREFMIIDNKLAENSVWNTKMLGSELTYLSTLGLELKAFDDSELKKYVIGSEDFEEYQDLNVVTSTTCPKCSYEW